MDKVKVDFVITDLELQLETNNNPYGSYVNFRFIDTFFEYFSNLPYWYQAIFIGVVSAIYGLKGADIMRKK